MTDKIDQHHSVKTFREKKNAAMRTMDENSTTDSTSMSDTITIGVLSLQGAFVEHIALLHQAIQHHHHHHTFTFLHVRTPADLSRCHALILPGGESTAISLIAERTGLLEPLRHFVKVRRRPVWGTCAGLILLAEQADRTKATGQALIGGLDVRVRRNHFGRQVESFAADLALAFLETGDGGGGGGGGGDATAAAFPAVFIRAPVVQRVLLPTASNGSSPDDPDTVLAPARQSTAAAVQILARLPVRGPADADADGAIVAVRQGNVFGTAFHPELTGDCRVHAWWLGEVVKAVEAERAS